MRSAVFVTAFLAAIVSSLSTPSTNSTQWVDLFDAPYTAAPALAMAISCFSDTDCYVPSGLPGSDFGVYKFDGHRNGQFTKLTLTKAPILLAAIAMGGTAEDPHGVVAGSGFGDGAAYATKNGTVFETSSLPTFLQSQDVRSNAAGTELLLVATLPRPFVYFSTDSGASFTGHEITSEVPMCSNARYGAMVSSTEWYVTLGSWPKSSSGGKNVHELSQRVVLENGRRVVRSRAEMAGTASEGCGYTAAIAKTTDGGNTWSTVFSSSQRGTFYFNGIDCASADVCVAAAEGFTSTAFASAYTTTDGGKTWKVTLQLPGDLADSISLWSVRFRTSTEVWIGGSRSTAAPGYALFYVSYDAGLTWEDRSGTLPNVVDLTSITFTPDGKHGFATGMTYLQRSTILRYGDGLPPAPPADTPSPATGSFVQKQCTASNCSQGCRSLTLPTGKCLEIQGGGSAVASCTPTALVQVYYPGSTDCSGAGETTHEPLNTCEQSTAGNYIEDICHSSTLRKAVVDHKAKLLLRRRL